MGYLDQPFICSKGREVKGLLLNKNNFTNIFTILNVFTRFKKLQITVHEISTLYTETEKTPMPSPEHVRF